MNVTVKIVCFTLLVMTLTWTIYAILKINTKAPVSEPIEIPPSSDKEMKVTFYLVNRYISFKSNITPDEFIYLLKRRPFITLGLERMVIQTSQIQYISFEELTENKERVD